ncbi:unnamed protein product [Phytophthora fragariaefolia]|uniref:Unnamed protein product n=1 Tax=Phytophthora fragariaefolia TaxID=1490495 RepID=A0A9W6XIC1_9STRA|nr:unnamed protein product [Phytophthora fragariaefolia]
MADGWHPGGSGKASHQREGLELGNTSDEDKGLMLNLLRRSMESLVTSMRDFPVPKDEKAVERFVHLAGSYRRFVANFESKAAPLMTLLRKAVAWGWDDKQQQALDWLKKDLIERPLLAYPNFIKPFKFVTGASAVDLGAAFMQDQDRGEQPIAFASKVNSSTVATYSITDLECAEVVWTIKRFWPYLCGGRFALVTDHNALSWLIKRQRSDWEAASLGTAAPGVRLQRAVSTRVD